MRDYSFGNFLHECRVRIGLTQYQLGVLVGVSDKAVSKWENGSSKPQSGILYKLSEVLGASVDELLSCKYHSVKKKDERGVFAMKKQFWDKAFDAMSERYGNPAPIEITSRFLTEQAEMQDTDMIVYFDMLSTLAIESKKQGEHICIRGGTGASLVAYLLGATKINPLKPHYYCPKCHTVIFDNSADDGWDLQKRKCACDKALRTDGHNIPFETYRCVVHNNTSFDVSVSQEFFFSAKSIIQEYFKDCKQTLEEREQNKVVTIRIASGESECRITLCVDERFARYKSLEQATVTCFDRVQFDCDDVLERFQHCDTDGIPEFETDFMKTMLNTVYPNSFRDLIQLSGLAHGTGVWSDNANVLVKQGVPVGKVIAYRDDVFNYIQEKMIAKGVADSGFTYRIMEDTRRGVYAKSVVPDYIKASLKAIGMEDWFIDSIGKIKYLFPKAHGVTYTKLAATLMWYKIHYPKEYIRFML